MWSIVAVGNLIVAIIGEVLLTAVKDLTGAREGHVEIDRHLVRKQFVPLLISAILPGWLMALGAWFSVSTSPGMSQFTSIDHVTFLIGNLIGGAIFVAVFEVARIRKTRATTDA